MSDHTTVRINYSEGEFEFTGTNSEVRGWLELFADDIRLLQNRFASAVSRAAVIPADNIRELEAAPASSVDSLPEAFGEFIHRFPRSITDIERALIAGFFLQGRSSDNSFTTGQVNELLQEQGIRLANPSASVKRNTEARRVFALGQGRFRVSMAGAEHLSQLQSAQS